jgi:hypothetical protein
VFFPISVPGSRIPDPNKKIEEWKKQFCCLTFL